MAETGSLISNTLRHSTLTEELRDAEIETLARIIPPRQCRAGEVVAWPGSGSEAGPGNSLVMLGNGEVEVSYNTGGATATLSLRNPGELIAVVGFVGGNTSQFSIRMAAKTDAVLLVLERARFEALLNSQPSVVYYVMRGIARHVHGIVRRLNMRAMELTSYLYQAKAR